MLQRSYRPHGPGVSLARLLTKTGSDGLEHLRHGETASAPADRWRGTFETVSEAWDVARRTHNPEVVGSNPTPATSSEAVPQTEGRPLLYVPYRFCPRVQRTGGPLARRTVTAILGVSYYS